MILLFVWGFTSHSRIFHSYGDVTISCEGLQILTYTRQSWPLSSEGSLAFHTDCDTGHPFIDRGGGAVVRLVSRRLYVRIPAATDLSRKNRCQTLGNRYECHGSSKMTVINGCPIYVTVGETYKNIYI